MTVRPVSSKHECILVGPQEEVSRVGQVGCPQGRDRPPLRGRSRHRQTLLQAARLARHLRAEEGSQQQTQAGRAAEKAPRRRPPIAPLGYLLSEGRIPFRRVRALGERGDDLPHAQALLAQPKERSLGARERDEFLRLLWHEEVGRLDPCGLVFLRTRWAPTPPWLPSTPTPP
jgi:hypothetical protein